ncbi:MAG TPA: enoyl-CoA hydratase/isomerase family protein [Dehalococcoidia bacterium]|nr:enoyl-CoA hydratase/isomerase family protein [Dehalococcoidia bacterium]
MPDEYQYLQTRREGATFVCTITNPPQNFLNAAILTELTRLAGEIENDETVRALVLTGGVEGIFITHYDVSELTGAAAIARERESFGAGELHALHKLLLRFGAWRVAVIAAINGTAMGGGCELTLGCDFRYMARGDYQIGLPEVRIGLLPGGGGTQRMARFLGQAKALEFMLLGNTLNADEAERVGLIHRACDADDLMPQVMALANELASRPPLSIELIKKCVRQGAEMPLEEALTLEQESFWKTMRSEDAARLMRAYLKSDRPLDQQ